jgi:hypothetical protein
MIRSCPPGEAPGRLRQEAEARVEEKKTTGA